MNKYSLNFQEDETPKYIQIAKHIKNLIDLSQIEDGEKLPSIRSLSMQLKVNNVTIINAYNKLESEGYANQKIGSGTYAKIRDLGKSFKKEYSDTFKRLSSESIREYIDFTGEMACSDLFPVETFKAVLNEVLDRDGANALVYQEALGYEGLRSTINKFFWNNSIEDDDILIVSGAQQGIDIASKVMLNVNDNVVIERPTYSGALSVFKGRRANIFEIELEEDGINIEQLENVLKKNKIKCFYAMSYFQNPTGISYSLEKKKEILELAEKYDFYVIEDDYLSELIYNSKIRYESFKSIDTCDRVIYIKSFSKIFLPGIRLGYLICPNKFKDQMQSSKLNTDISTSSLMQRTLDLYINKGFWKEYINNLNSIYIKRYSFLKDAINTILNGKVSFNDPGGGLNYYLRISDDINLDCIKLFSNCRKEKVLITPGVLFYKNYLEGAKYFRIGFSQVDNVQIEKGLGLINDILKVSD